MPSLTILAWPNGAGKTRNSDFLLSQNIISTTPIDLDLLAEQAIDDLPHSAYGAETRLAKSMDKLFYAYCIEAIKKNEDFCYECNFRRDQLKYVSLFEDAGYSLNLIFFTLNTTEQSMQRVKFRVSKQNGKFVDNESILENFKQGLSNLDNHYQDFDHVIIIDNSQDNYLPANLPLNVQIDIEKDIVTCYNKNYPPDELKHYLPNITVLLKNIKH